MNAPLWLVCMSGNLFDTPRLWAEIMFFLLHLAATAVLFLALIGPWLINCAASRLVGSWSCDGNAAFFQKPLPGSWLLGLMKTYNSLLGRDSLFCAPFVTFFFWHVSFPFHPELQNSLCHHQPMMRGLPCIIFSQCTLFWSTMFMPLRLYLGNKKVVETNFLSGSLEVIREVSGHEFWSAGCTVMTLHLKRMSSPLSNFSYVVCCKYNVRKLLLKWWCCSGCTESLVEVKGFLVKLDGTGEAVTPCFHLKSWKNKAENKHNPKVDHVCA